MICKNDQSASEIYITFSLHQKADPLNCQRCDVIGWNKFRWSYFCRTVVHSYISAKERKKLSFIKVRQSRNDFLNPMILPKKRTNEFDFTIVQLISE